MIMEFAVKSEMKQQTPRYIVVEGPIGVGKTSLVKRLAETFNSEMLLEEAEANPFLERFYQNPHQAALPAQLFFLLQRARQMQSGRQTDMFQSGRVSDFMMEKDRLFAEVTLADDELKLYDQVYRQLTLDIPAPDLVIYLQAPVEILLARIARRGLEYEKLIGSAYLQRLVDAYARFFHYYTAAPLLIVNAAVANFVDSDKDYNELVEHVHAQRRGRHYLNPLPFHL